MSNPKPPSGDEPLASARPPETVNYRPEDPRDRAFLRTCGGMRVGGSLIFPTGADSGPPPAGKMWMAVGDTLVTVDR